jgi:hypothetical protein
VESNTPYVCTQAEENLTQNSKIILYVEQFHNQTCVMLMLKVLNLGAFVILGLGTLNLYFKIIIIVSLDFFFFFFWRWDLAVIQAGLFLFLLLAALGFEFRTSRFLGRHSIT